MVTHTWFFLFVLEIFEESLIILWNVPLIWFIWCLFIIRYRLSLHYQEGCLRSGEASFSVQDIKQMSVCWFVPVAGLNFVFLVEVSARLLFFLLQLIFWDYVAISFLTKLPPVFRIHWWFSNYLSFYIY